MLTYIIAGVVLGALAITPRLIQGIRRRRFPAAQFAREALERHEVNLKGVGMWHEQERKASEGIG